MAVNYLLDSNIYNILRKSPDSKALRNFNASIDSIPSIPQKDVKWRMTPFSVMEAIGVVIDDPKITLPSNIISGGAVDCFTYIVNTSKEYYLSVINIEEFIAKATYQSSFTSKSLLCTTLEKACVYKPLLAKTFSNTLSDHLAFDFALKFNFPKTFDFEITDKFSVNSFFQEHPYTSRMSKFRLTKKFWDKIHQNLKRDNPKEAQTIQDMNKSMSLKYSQDFLDCDLIHLATVGDYDGQNFRPTVIFTCDHGQSIVYRVMTYKTHIEFLKSNLEPELNDKLSHFYNKWNQGILVFCNRDGSIQSHIEVADIKPFINFKNPTTH